MNDLRKHLRKAIGTKLKEHDISYSELARRMKQSRQNVWKAMQPPGPGVTSANQIIKALKRMGIEVYTGLDNAVNKKVDKPKRGK